MYCNKCEVTVKGAKSCCPLCRGELSGEPDINEEAFPRIKDKVYDKNRFLKIVTFAAIVTIVCSVAVNMIIPMKNHVWWSLFVSAGVVCAWISIVTAIMKRRNILKNILLFNLSTSQTTRNNTTQEDNRHVLSFLAWIPPLNFRMNINGKIIINPCIVLPNKLPIISISTIGVTVKKRLYTAYSYNSLSSLCTVSDSTSHLTIHFDKYLTVIYHL